MAGGFFILSGFMLLLYVPLALIARRVSRDRSVGETSALHSS